MHIPRHPERGSLGRVHRSSIEARRLVSASGEVLILSDFVQHTHTRGKRKSAQHYEALLIPAGLTLMLIHYTTCNCILHTLGINQAVTQVCLY